MEGYGALQFFTEEKLSRTPILVRYRNRHGALRGRSVRAMALAFVRLALNWAVCTLPTQLIQVFERRVRSQLDGSSQGDDRANSFFFKLTHTQKHKTIESRKALR